MSETGASGPGLPEPLLRREFPPLRFPWQPEVVWIRGPSAKDDRAKLLFTYTRESRRGSQCIARIMQFVLYGVMCLGSVEGFRSDSVLHLACCDLVCCNLACVWGGRELRVCGRRSLYSTQTHTFARRAAFLFLSARGRLVGRLPMIRSCFFDHCKKVIKKVHV